MKPIRPCTEEGQQILIHSSSPYLAEANQGKNSATVNFSHS